MLEEAIMQQVTGVQALGALALVGVGSYVDRKHSRNKIYDRLTKLELATAVLQEIMERVERAQRAQK